MMQKPCSEIKTGEIEQQVDKKHGCREEMHCHYLGDY